METMQQMTCPKCHGQMNSYERSGIVVDQCTNCRGLFLDRGELERLLDLEAGAVQPQQPQWSAPAPQRDWRPQQPQHRDWRSKHDWDDDSDRRHHGSGGHGYPKKKKSLLREFLDFD